MKDNLVFNVVQLIIADFPEYSGLCLTVTLNGVEGPCYSAVFRVSWALPAKWIIVSVESGVILSNSFQVTNLS